MFPTCQDVAFLVVSTQAIFLLGSQTSTLTSLLPSLNLAPSSLALCLQFIIAGAELGNGLLGEQLLERPLFDVLGLILLQLCDELDGALEDRPFVLLTSWDNLG